MTSSKAYSDHVLRDNFNDARRLFFHYLMDIHYAHLLMLHRTGILGTPEAARLAAGLDQISEESISQVEYDGSFEDLFFYLEQILAESCGEDLAGRLHTARSRNDIAVTLYRLRWRQSTLQLIESLFFLRRCFLEISRKHKVSILPIHTHTQPAQPTTLAHYSLGVVEHLERDHARLSVALDRLNRCPMGACAITGTGFPIDRTITSDLLGFDGPTGNTHASIVGVDYLLEVTGAVMVSLTTLGRVLQDLLLWCMAEFQFLRLAEGYVQCSSIMPQKRNPVALEHCRALTSRSLGEAQAVFHTIHNTPYGDIADVEDDLQPLIDHMFRNSTRSIRLLAEALSSATFDVRKMRERAGENWITITELADTLVRSQGISFKAAHAVASQLVSALKENPELKVSETLSRVSEAVLTHAVHYSEAEIASILSPEHFVAVRTTSGGPAPEPIEEALASSLDRASCDEAWIQKKQAQLDTYRPLLREGAAKLSLPDGN